MTGVPLARPVLLDADHDVSQFSCGVESLDSWLRDSALKNQVANASRVFVLCEDRVVVGYYALAAGAIARASAPGSIRRNMPDPIPVTILGRLAVDTRLQGSGLGSELLRDALVRCLGAAEYVASKAVVVHAISSEARRWYLANGFIELPHDPMMLLLPLATIRSAR